MGVMSFMLFYTDFVGEGLYEGVPSAAPGTDLRQRYDEGELFFQICIQPQIVQNMYMCNTKDLKYLVSSRRGASSFVTNIL